MLWRLSASDALVETDRNNAIEARTSIFLSFVMVALGFVLIFFAAIDVAVLADGPFTVSEAGMDVATAVPSIVVYLIIGMLQLNMAFVLRLRSLVQDALISLLGTIVAAGTLVSSIVDMLAYIQAAEPFLNNVTCNISIGQDRVLVSEGAAVPFLYYNRQRWVQYAVSIITASTICFSGLAYLFADTYHGHRWWTVAFWCGPLPPRPTTEHSPLKERA